MANFPLAIFKTALDKQLVRTTRQPSKKHLGTELRKSDQVLTTVDVLNDQFSTARGLPPSIENKKDKDKPDLGRKEDGSLAPWKTTATADTYSTASVCRSPPT
jgi:hypothetical protein